MHRNPLLYLLLLAELPFYYAFTMGFLRDPNPLPIVLGVAFLASTLSLFFLDWKPEHEDQSDR